MQYVEKLKTCLLMIFNFDPENGEFLLPERQKVLQFSGLDFSFSDQLRLGAGPGPHQFNTEKVLSSTLQPFIITIHIERLSRQEKWAHGCRGSFYYLRLGYYRGQ